MSPVSSRGSFACRRFSIKRDMIIEPSLPMRERRASVNRLLRKGAKSTNGCRTPDIGKAEATASCYVKIISRREETRKLE